MRDLPTPVGACRNTTFAPCWNLSCTSSIISSCPSLNSVTQSGRAINPHLGFVIVLVFGLIISFFFVGVIGYLTSRRYPPVIGGDRDGVEHPLTGVARMGVRPGLLRDLGEDAS